MPIEMEKGAGLQLDSVDTSMHKQNLVKWRVN